MGIPSKATNKNYLANYDRTFKGKVNNRCEINEIFQVCAKAGDSYKVTARFYSLKDAQAYAKQYPNEATHGIYLPDGCLDTLED